MVGRSRGLTPGVGFVFQNDAVFPWKTVLDNVAAGPRFHGASTSAANRLPGTGSGGSDWPDSRTATRINCPAACANESHSRKA